MEDWFTLAKTGSGDDTEWAIKFYYNGNMNNAVYGFSDYAEALYIAEQMTIERRGGVALYDSFESRQENGVFALYWYDSSGRAFFKDGTWQTYKQLADFATSERRYVERLRLQALKLTGGDDDIHNTGIDLNGFNPYPSDGEDPNYGPAALHRAGIVTPDYIPARCADLNDDIPPWEGEYNFPSNYKTFDEKWAEGVAKFFEVTND